MIRQRKPPSQTWRTFLTNHTPEISAIDFFTLATAGFRQLYAFVVLAHDRRRVLHFNVTNSPTAAWTAQQIIEAFPWNTAPRYLLRDRDGVYGDEFRRRGIRWCSRRASCRCRMEDVPESTLVFRRGASWRS